MPLGPGDRVVVRVCAVGAGHPADVLRSESRTELLGVPELGGHLGRGDELVPRGPLAAGALALGVVHGQVRAAATITVSHNRQRSPRAKGFEENARGRQR